MIVVRTRRWTYLDMVLSGPSSIILPEVGRMKDVLNSQTTLQTLGMERGQAKLQRISQSKHSQPVFRPFTALLSECNHVYFMLALPYRGRATLGASIQCHDIEVCCCHELSRKHLGRLLDMDVIRNVSPMAEDHRHPLCPRTSQPPIVS